MTSTTKRIQQSNFEPKDAEGFSFRGGWWLDKKRYDEAIKDLNKALDLDPKCVSAWATRGDVWFVTKQYDKALWDYNEAICLNPEYAYALEKKAYLLATCPEDKLRDGRQALELAEKATGLRGQGTIYGWKMRS